jgi:Flp pilus assembly protein TadB
MPRSARRRRRRKHRGTQAGSIDRRGRTSRPRSRAEARAKARTTTSQRQQQPPTWRGAINRGLIAAAIFFLLLALLFRRPVVQSLAISILMIAIYIPMGYYIDRFFYRLRQRREQKERDQRRAERGKA